MALCSRMTTPWMMQTLSPRDVLPEYRISTNAIFLQGWHKVKLSNRLQWAEGFQGPTEQSTEWGWRVIPVDQRIRNSCALSSWQNTPWKRKRSKEAFWSYQCASLTNLLEHKRNMKHCSWQENNNNKTKNHPVLDSLSKCSVVCHAAPGSVRPGGALSTLM